MSLRKDLNKLRQDVVTQWEIFEAVLSDLRKKIEDDQYTEFLSQHSIQQKQWDIFAEYGIAIKNKICIKDLPVENCKLVDIDPARFSKDVFCNLTDIKIDGMESILSYRTPFNAYPLRHWVLNETLSLSPIKLTLNQYKEMINSKLTAPGLTLTISSKGTNDIPQTGYVNFIDKHYDEKIPKTPKKCKTNTKKGKNK